MLIKMVSSNSEWRNDVSKDMADLAKETYHECDEVFGLWISSIFDWREGLNIHEKKEYFLELVRILMDKRVIVIFPPADIYMSHDFKKEECCYSLYDRDDLWRASSEDVVEYIRKHWPDGVMSVHDLKLNDFWYDDVCPGVGWVDDKNKKIIVS